MANVRAFHGVHIGVAALIIATGAWTAEARKPAEQELASIRATKAGVDANNNFWAWDRQRRVITRISPDGNRGESDILPDDPWSADADQERGIALLTDAGREIDIVDWNGSPKRSIRLRHTATDVAWLRGNQIATSPRTTGPCIEIWDASTGEYLSGFGTCPDVKPAHVGALAGRAALLRYDPAHREIIMFDAFRGDLTAFSESGATTRTSHISSPKDAAIDAWLKEVDAKARHDGASESSVIFKYASMTIAPDRSIWLGEEADPHGFVIAVRILQDGTVQRTRIDVPQCPSIRFISWNDDFVFFHDPNSPQPLCVAVMRRK